MFSSPSPIYLDRIFGVYVLNFDILTSLSLFYRKKNIQKVFFSYFPVLTGRSLISRTVFPALVQCISQTILIGELLELLLTLFEERRGVIYWDHC